MFIRGNMLKMRKTGKQDNSESRLTYLINQLKNKLDNEDLNRTYNRLLVERAALRKKIKYSSSKNVLINFCQKLSRRKQEKLICDYFKA